MSTYKGIDVSYAQQFIDWNKAKDEIDFVIIRASWGTNIDARFEYNQHKCEELNIPYGVFCFSYATSIADAAAEAEKTYKLIKDHKLSYPVYYDFEYDSIKHFAKVNGKEPDPTTFCNYTRIFCDYMKSHGYYPGIYTNLDMIQRYYGEEIFKYYDLWYAYWAKTHSRPVKMWQYGTTKISGIHGPVDADISYFDYPSYFKTAGINGFRKDNRKTNIEIAKEVIQGLWGAGPVRRAKLTAAGYDYKEIQGIVNQMLSAGR